jgi:endonuclease/exonuclease/phosphatase family metal-dependent hydrolase
MRKLIFLPVFLWLLSAEAQPVKVMTYNIRYDNPGDGLNQWSNRRSKVFALIKKYDPDIIGVQEALHHQLEDIKKDLKQYDFFGAGRDDGKQKGEYSAVFIKRKRFGLLNANTFWLSLTPGVPGSKDWDAAITRVVTRGKLHDKKSRKTFFIINTHFDHRGKESRKHSAAILKDSAAVMGEDLPLIVTGDFNFTREQPPYAVMMDRSTIELIDTAPSGVPGTACGFEVGSRPCTAIDYIYHTRQWKADGYQVIQDNDGKYYPSDHLPVMVTLSLPE